MNTILEGIDLAVKVAEKLTLNQQKKQADLTLNLGTGESLGETKISIINVGQCAATDIVIKAIGPSGEDKQYWWEASEELTYKISYMAPHTPRQVVFNNFSYNNIDVTFDIHWKDKRKGIQTKSITLNFEGICN